MDIGRSDLTLFVYNVALVVSGGFPVIRFGIDDINVLLGMSLVFGFFWTIYFRYRMTSILAGIAADEAEEDDSADEEPQDEDETPEQGPDAPWN